MRNFDDIIHTDAPLDAIEEQLRDLLPELFKQKDKSDYVLLLVRISWIQRCQNKMDIAEGTIHQADSFLENIDPIARYAYFLELGSCAFAKKDYQQAVENLEVAYNLADSNHLHPEIIHVADALSLACVTDLSSQIRWLKHTLHLAQTHPHEEYPEQRLGAMHWRLGETLLLQSNSDEAYEAFDKARRIAAEVKDSWLEGAAYLNIAKIYRERGDYENSRAHLETAKEKYGSLREKEPQNKELLTFILKKAGEEEAALKHKEIFPYRMIDLTHPLEEGIPAWDLSCGFKHVIVSKHSSTPPSFEVGQLEMPCGIGTHMDAPAHCYSGSKTIDQISLENLTHPCVMIDVSAQVQDNPDYVISVADIEAFEATHGPIRPAEFILFYTGWSRYWNQPNRYRNNLQFPSISEDTALYLLEKGIAGLGTDTLSPDTSLSNYPVHQHILGAEKYLLENVAHLDRLPPRGATLLTLPLKIKGGTEAPVRLVALVKV